MTENVRKMLDSKQNISTRMVANEELLQMGPKVHLRCHVAALTLLFFEPHLISSCNVGA